MNTVTVRDLTIGAGRPKICIPIFGESMDEILQNAHLAADSEAELIEWRIDYFADFLQPQAVGQAAAAISAELKGKPLLCTFRSKKEGGEAAQTEEGYFHMYEAILTAGGADLIDVELYAGEQVVESLIGLAHENGRKVLVSSHDFAKTPDTQELKKRFYKMEEIGADIAKIAVMPQSRQDVLRLMTATWELRGQGFSIPTVAISMGKLGMVSRIAGELYGSDITFASLVKASAPGQWQLDKMREILDELHIEDNCFSSEN